jgi:hypothetical protein
MGNHSGFNKIIKAKAGLESVPIVQNKPKAMLNQNTPNPVSSQTTIEFALQHSGFVSLVVYNSVGQLVAAPVNGEMTAGKHQIEFLASDYPSGTYFYKLQTVDGTECRRMQIIR